MAYSDQKINQLIVHDETNFWIVIGVQVIACSDLSYKTLYRRKCIMEKNQAKSLRFTDTGKLYKFLLKMASGNNDHEPNEFHVMKSRKQNRALVTHPAMEIPLTIEENQLKELSDKKLIKITWFFSSFFSFKIADIV